MTEHPRNNFYLKEETSDGDLVRWFAEFHYLQPVHVQLLSRRPIVSVRRRLAKLHKEDFLNRKTLPYARNSPVSTPPDQYVYYLKPKGLSLARQLGFTDQDTRHNPEKSEALLPHDLFLTTFHLALMLATQATENLHLIHWEQRRSALQDSVHASYDRYSVNPDALFYLKDDTKPATGNTSYFFLEYERSRPTGHERGESNFIRKMRGFLEYQAKGAAKKRWNIPNFYVLTITPTEERAMNLCRGLAECDPPLPYKRFWFTDASNVSLEQPAKLLEPIFFTPKDYEQGVSYRLTS